jgi:hypothetical protein
MFGKGNLYLLGKVLGGTGILPVRVRRLKACATKGGGHGGPPHRTFHNLRVGQRPMNDCLEKFS